MPDRTGGSGENHAIVVIGLWSLVVGRGSFVKLPRPATNDQRPTTNDQRPTTNDQRPTTNDQRPTTNDQRPTTNDQRPTTNDQRLRRVLASQLALGTRSQSAPAAAL